MGTDGNWDEEELKQFSEEFSKHKTLNLDCTLYTIFMTNSEVLCKMSRALNLDLSAYDMLQMCYSFREAAIKKMRTYIGEGGAWSDAWGAPQWLRSLEPNLALIEKALEAEIADGGRPMARVVSELAAGARADVAGAAQPGQALRSGDAVRALARARRLPADGLASLWCILYSESIRHMRLLWAAGDRAHAAGWTTRACWDVVELALEYDKQLALITPKCLKAKKVVNALTLLFELISSAYSEIEEKEKARGGANGRHDGGEPRLSRERERALWQRVHNEYMNSGRVVSALALQRRWCGLRRLAREQLRPVARRCSPAHRLLLAVALRFPWVVAARQPSWELLVRRGRVYRLPAASPVNFEQPYSLEQKHSDPIEEETAETTDSVPCVEVLDDDDGARDASRARAPDVASGTAVHDTLSDVTKHNGINCVKASNLHASRDKSKNNVLDEEATAKSDPGTGNRILYVDYEKSVGSRIQDINEPNNFIDSLQNRDIPFLDVSIDLSGVPPNETTRGAEPDEKRAREHASSAVRALIDSVACEPQPTVFNNSTIIVIPSLKITKIITSDKTNICCRSTMHEKCNIKRTKSEYEAEDTEASKAPNIIHKNEDTSAGRHDVMVEMPTDPNDKGRQNVSSPRRPGAVALDDKLMQEAEVIVRPLEYIPIWRTFSRNGVINCRRISMRKLVSAGVGKRCRDALRRYAVGSGRDKERAGRDGPREGRDKEWAGRDGPREGRGEMGAGHERARALAGTLSLSALSQSFWKKNIAQLQMLKPARVILKRLTSREEDGGAAGNGRVYETDKRISVQKNDSKYHGMLKVTPARTDASSNLQQTDDRLPDERQNESQQTHERQMAAPATQQHSIVPGIVSDTNKFVQKRKSIKTTKSTVKQKPRKYSKRRPKVTAESQRQLTPLEEWERQKNITRLYFDFPLRGGGRGGVARVKARHKNMSNSEVEASAAVLYANEGGVSDAGRSNNDRCKMPKTVEHVRNKNNFTSCPPAPADDDVIFVDSTDSLRPSPVIVSVTSLAGAVGGAGRPPDNELVVVKGDLPSAGQTASKPFEIALSLHRSISVEEYVSSGQCLLNPLFRLDGTKPLRVLLGEYIVVTTDDVPVARPTYWTGGGMTTFACARICFPPETSAKYLEFLMCECNGPSNKCDLCSAIARGAAGVKSAEAQGAAGVESADAQGAAGVESADAQGAAGVESAGARGERGAAKIKVKSFAKLPKVDDDEDTCPLMINSGSKTFRKTSSDPLVYANIDNFELDPELVSCKVINKVLFKRLYGNNFVKVLTAVCDSTEVRRLARSGRPLLCSSFRTGEPPPPGLFRELQRVIGGEDLLH